MPCDYKLYPANWKTEIVPRIRERAGNRCEWCGLPNHAYVNKMTRQLVLPDEEKAVWIICTTAHINHDINDNRDENLAYLCQKCHNGHDRFHRRRNKKQSQSRHHNYEQRRPCI